MKRYTDCYIAFIDLLGFKGLVTQKECDEIAHIFDEINVHFIVTVNETGEPLMDFSKIKMKIMSDTICLYVRASEKNSLAGIVATCDYFQVRMMRLDEPILTRGAIVRGNIYATGDVTFGPGVSNAYLLEEKTAKYPRIILTKSTIDEWESGDSEGYNYVKLYTYRDSDAFYVVDSLYLFYGLDHDCPAWKTFVKYVQDKLNTEVDVSIRKKYLYIEKNVPRIAQKYLESFEVTANA